MPRRAQAAPEGSSDAPDQKNNKPDDPMPGGRPLNGIPNAAQFDWGAVPVDDKEMGDWKVADRTIGELSKKHDKPFFLGCGFFRPHLPWYVPQKYFDMYRAAEWERPALTTHGKDNHSLRTERWRYIRYSDGSEELYDHDNDELEWTNLAGDPKYAGVKAGLIRWLPKESASEVRGGQGLRRPAADD